MSVSPFGLFCIPMADEKREWQKVSDRVDESRSNDGVALMDDVLRVVVCKWPRTRMIVEARLTRPRKLCFDCEESWFVDNCGNDRKRVDCNFRVRYGDFVTETHRREEDVSWKTRGLHIHRRAGRARCVRTLLVK